jgi:hypothetical protein
MIENHSNITGNVASKPTSRALDVRNFPTILFPLSGNVSGRIITCSSPLPHYHCNSTIILWHVRETELSIARLWHSKHDATKQESIATEWSGKQCLCESGNVMQQWSNCEKQCFLRDLTWGSNTTKEHVMAHRTCQQKKCFLCDACWGYIKESAWAGSQLSHWPWVQLEWLS